MTIHLFKTTEVSNHYVYKFGNDALKYIYDYVCQKVPTCRMPFKEFASKYFSADFLSDFEDKVVDNGIRDGSKLDPIEQAMHDAIVDILHYKGEKYTWKKQTYESIRIDLPTYGLIG